MAQFCIWICKTSFPSSVSLCPAEEFGHFIWCLSVKLGLRTRKWEDFSNSYEKYGCFVRRYGFGQISVEFRKLFTDRISDITIFLRITLWIIFFPKYYEHCKYVFVLQWSNSTFSMHRNLNSWTYSVRNLLRSYKGNKGIVWKVILLTLNFYKFGISA